MFKVIHNNVVVDILETVTYVRYLKKSNKFVNTDKTSADGFRSSSMDTVYILEGKDCPPRKNLLIVKLVKITKSEYDNLRLLMDTQNSIEADTLVLKYSRQLKLAELSVACNNAITAGVTVLLSDGVYHDFRLTVEDQLNLASFQNQINNGVKKFLYHETGKLVRWFTSDDMNLIISAADRHRFKHTTYYNLLKHCIHNMYNKDEIESVYYGIPLETLPAPKDVQFNMKEYNIG
jgi:hypothetical protein